MVKYTSDILVSLTIKLKQKTEAKTFLSKRKKLVKYYNLRK